MISRVLHRPDALPAAMPPTLLTNLEELAARDRWFYDHFVWAPNIVADFLSRVIPLGPAVVLDFGCGEGLMAKGLARLAREVHGVDVMPMFGQLEERFERMFGAGNPFPPVTLRLVQAGELLPYEDGAFDAVFAWSVFEHVANVPYVLSEIHRVIRPGGAFFLQISPLYFSAQGGHLWNILDEPWIHLRLGREELLERIRHARPTIRIWVYMKQVTFPSLLFPIFTLLPHFTPLAWPATDDQCTSTGTAWRTPD